MLITTNESCHLTNSNDAHYDHAMLALAVWQTVIAVLATLVAIIFGLLNGGHLRTSQVLYRC